MAFVKKLKTSAYFKKFQVKYRRRREGKTDYQQRKYLVKQDRNKYNTPKHRLIVRTTNRKVICQIAYATIAGDKVVCQATSDDLKGFGVTVGLSNYAACYATGLLIARRMLKKLGMDKAIEGVKKVDGKEFHVEDEDHERKPFKCLLDIGLKRTTVGARPFGCLKGAVDGGLHVPHSIKRFPGFKKGTKDVDDKYDEEFHRDRILGAHVSEYMESMEEDDPEKYQAHFSKYIAAGIDADGLAGVYEKAHAAIRANPDFKKKPVAPIKRTREGATVTPSKGKPYDRHKKLSCDERKERVYAKIRAAMQS